MSFFISFIIFVVKAILVVISPFVTMGLIFYIYYYFRGYRRKKGLYKYVGHGFIIKRLLWDFPKRFVLDLYERDPDRFREYGVHIIAGEQGCGKSITLTYMLMRYQKMYPRMLVKTNYCYANEDGQITHWKDVVDGTNGIYGEIDVIDEIQNWFNSLQSKDFPPEMLQEITQQRKQTKCIIGTSQVFTRVAKPLREQTYLLYEPITLFGCLTFVRVYKPVLNADGCCDDKKLRDIFFFVHSAELRNNYDTLKKIQTLVKSGFKTETDQLRNGSSRTVIELQKQ